MTMAKPSQKIAAQGGCLPVVDPDPFTAVFVRLFTAGLELDFLGVLRTATI